MTTTNQIESASNKKSAHGSRIVETLRAEDVATCAYYKWITRGSPVDDAEADWFAAERELHAVATNGVNLSDK